MTPIDDDRPLGWPRQVPRPSTSVLYDNSGGEHCPDDTHGDACLSVKEGPSRSAESPPDAPRADEGMGRPIQAPINPRPLTPDDLEFIRKAEDAQLKAEERMVEEVLASHGVVFRLPRFVSEPLAIAVALGVAALLGLFVFSHVTSTLASLQALPAGVRYAGWATLTILSGTVAYACGRIAWTYCRLKPNQPIRLAGLAELSRRTALRQHAAKKQANAKEQLRNYLRNYPLEVGDRSRLLAAGMDDGDLSKLKKAKEKLLDNDQFASFQDWFELFNAEFQGVIEKAATKRVERVAKRVGIVTAASPNSFVDMAVTAHGAFTLMADLCQLYHLRVSRVGTAVLVARVFTNTYLAGQANEWEEVAANGIEQVTLESGQHLGVLVFEGTVAKLVGKAGAKVSAGFLNYYLLKRLGNYAIRLVRPLDVQR